MKQKITERYAQSVLDRLVDLDRTTTDAFYEMGRLLTAIKRDRLWDVLGYDSFPHLVENELSFTASTAYRYANTYRHFQRLGYSKATALEFMGEFSFSVMADVLPQTEGKIGKRAMKNRVMQWTEKNVQINFTLTGEQYAEATGVLTEIGAMRTDAGRLLHSSEAFMALIRAAKRREVAPRLKLVSSR